MHKLGTVKKSWNSKKSLANFPYVYVVQALPGSLENVILKGMKPKSAFVAYAS